MRTDTSVESTSYDGFEACSHRARFCVKGRPDDQLGLVWTRGADQNPRL